MSLKEKKTVKEREDKEVVSNTSGKEVVPSAPPRSRQWQPPHGMAKRRNKRYKKVIMTNRPNKNLTMEAPHPQATDKGNGKDKPRGDH